MAEMFVEKKLITKAEMSADTIRLEIPIPLGFIPTGLAADSLGGSGNKLEIGSD